MTEVLQSFCIAFLFSFVGTIPPGTLNLTIIQLGLTSRIAAAWRMSLAAGLIEYPYAWAALEFQDLVTHQVNLSEGFHLLAGSVMILLGVLNFVSAARPSRFPRKSEKSGFRKGLLLGLLNPLAIPFWIAMTAYLKSYGWVDLSNQYEIHAYLLGVSTGTIALCMLLAYLAGKVVSHFQTNRFLQLTPGVILVLLGIYSFLKFIFG